MSGPSILVVEDDARLRLSLIRALGEAYDVDAVPEGRSALKRLDASRHYDLIILDVGLPDSDGRDVCQALRSRGVQTPVLFLTARGQIDDELSAFAAGGDDFLAKPFHLPVLLARLASLSRRGTVRVDRAVVDLRLDPASHAAIHCGHLIPLTPTEYRVLGCLLAASATVVRRRAIVNAGWSMNAQVGDNTLDQYVARLRRKLASAGSGVRLVTVHGVGYRLETTAES